MQRIPVQSSDLVAVGYDDISQTLEIEFKEGRIYQYFEVPRDIHKGLLRAESPGTYFFSHINAYFRYRRVVEQSKFVFTRPNTVTFVTGNQRKVRDMQRACTPLGITVKQQQFDIHEIQAHDPAKISEHKINKAFIRAGGVPTVINDDFWAIPTLNGFPGGYMKDVQQWLTDEDFIHLMQDKTDRRILLTQTIMYKDNKQSRTFSQEVWGVIVDKPRGTGNSMERVVSLGDSGKTLAELQEQKEQNLPDATTVWQDFAEWFINRS
jgi:non-canonical purine NTP pyrophosphatase (RdgB/HAM1 family)